MSQISTSRRGRVRRRRLASVIGSPPVRRLLRRVRRRSSCSPLRARRLRRESRRGAASSSSLIIRRIRSSSSGSSSSNRFSPRRSSSLAIASGTSISRSWSSVLGSEEVPRMPPDRSFSRSPGTDRALRVGWALAGLRAAQRRRVRVAAFLVGLQRGVEDGREDAVERRQLRLGGDEDRSRRPVEVAATLRRDQRQRARETGRALGRDRDPRGAQPLAQRGRQARDVDPVQLQHGPY